MILIAPIRCLVVCAGHEQCLLAVLHLLESLIVVLLHLLVLKQAGDAIRANHHLLLAALYQLLLRHLKLQLVVDGLLQGPLVRLFGPGLLPACPTPLGRHFIRFLALPIIELLDHEVL